MKRLIFATMFLLAAPALLFGQTKERNGHGYVFFGPSGVGDGGTVFTHTGVGGEGLVYKGVGVGAEVGYFTPARSWGDGIGLFSVNGSYHFKGASQSGKFVPFVTGGYTLFFREGVANGGNFGGGMNYWFKERTAVRVEFRNHLYAADLRASYYSFRFGLTFR